MKLDAVARLILLFAGLSLITPPRLAVAQKLPLAFDGKSLTGWRVPNENVWWSVEQGTLKAENGPKRTGSILWTEKEYVNFVVELEFKFGHGTVDTGVFLRTDTQQIQIGISGSLKRDMTGSPYISGKGYPVEAKGVSELLRPKDWNAMTIVAKRTHYTVWLNGKHVMTYDSENAAAKGPIGLQLHGGNEMSVHFRNLRIAELQ